MSKQLKTKDIANKFVIDKAVKVSKFGNGLINDTYLVQSNNGKYVLQKLHPIFKPAVLADTHNVTRYLLNNKFTTPLLVRNKNGKLFFTDDKITTGGCLPMFRAGATKRV